MSQTYLAERRFPHLLCLLFVSLGLGPGCTPAPEPGELGGVCVEGDLCDFGLLCVAGSCHRSPSGMQPSNAEGTDSGVTDPGSTDVSAAGSTGQAGTSGSGAAGNSGIGGNTGGGPGGGRGGASSGGASSGGAAGTSGGSAGSSAGASGAAGSSATNCVGIPAVNGQCNRNSCLCSASDECFPRASASACCSVVPTCR